MKLLSIYSLLIVLSAACISCGQNQEKIDDQRITDANAQILKNAGSFDPQVSRDTARQHIGLTIRFNNNTFIQDSSATVRPGRLPYLQQNGQPFEVVYKDASGRQLGSYHIENPTTITSCDASGQPTTKQLASGSFDLLLPYNTAIRSVELRSGDKRISGFRVSLITGNTQSPTGVIR